MVLGGTSAVEDFGGGTPPRKWNVTTTAMVETIPAVLTFVKRAGSL